MLFRSRRPVGLKLEVDGQDLERISDREQGRERPREGRKLASHSDYPIRCGGPENISAASTRILAVVLAESHCPRARIHS